MCASASRSKSRWGCVRACSRILRSASTWRMRRPDRSRHASWLVVAAPEVPAPRSRLPNRPCRRRREAAGCTRCPRGGAPGSRAGAYTRAPHATRSSASGAPHGARAECAGEAAEGDAPRGVAGEVHAPRAAVQAADEHLRRHPRRRHRGVGCACRTGGGRPERGSVRPNVFAPLLLYRTRPIAERPNDLVGRSSSLKKRHHRNRSRKTSGGALVRPHLRRAPFRDDGRDHDEREEAPDRRGATHSSARSSAGAGGAPAPRRRGRAPARRAAGDRLRHPAPVGARGRAGGDREVFGAGKGDAPAASASGAPTEATKASPPRRSGRRRTRRSDPARRRRSPAPPRSGECADRRGHRRETRAGRG